MTTSWGQAQASRYSELAALWARADSLDEKELTRLCLLVSEILSGCSKANLAPTDMDIEDLIQSFIAEKILYPLQTAPDKFKRQMPTSHGALIMYFQRVVTSRARTSESRLKRRSEGLEVEAETESRPRPPLCAPRGRKALAIGQVRSSACMHWGSPSRPLSVGANASSVAWLRLSGTCSAIFSTATWRSPSSTRIRPGCRPKPDWQRPRLGLWRGNTAGRNVAAFANTRIGRFMSQAIGQPLDASHLEAIEALMGLLCDVACNEVS